MVKLTMLIKETQANKTYYVFLNISRAITCVDYYGSGGGRGGMFFLASLVYCSHVFS